MIMLIGLSEEWVKTKPVAKCLTKKCNEKDVLTTPITDSDKQILRYTDIY